MDKVRQSNFELIRILAQFFIVFYHIFGFFIYPSTHNPLHRAIWLPLHIGVILFILISGYFGIKASIRGFVKLVGMMAVLYIPLALANYLIMRGGVKMSYLPYSYSFPRSHFGICAPMCSYISLHRSSI